MRKIDVSTDVFAAIWAARQASENSEDEVLGRLLGVKKGRRDVAERLAQGRARWVDDVASALRELGGGGLYADIYREVRKIRLANGRSVPPSFEEVVRKEIETHSSDSEAFQGREDYFHAPKGKGAGYWQLR